MQLCRTRNAAAPQTNPPTGTTLATRSCPTSFPEHVQTSLLLVEQAIAREASPGSQEADIIELDDVTPPFVKATAALNACGANLAIALHALLDSKAPEHHPGHLARISTQQRRAAAAGVKPR